MQNGCLWTCWACMLTNGFASGCPSGFPFGHFIGVRHERFNKRNIERNILVEAEFLRPLNKPIAANLGAQLAVDCIGRKLGCASKRNFSIGIIAKVVHLAVTDGHFSRGGEYA